MKLSPRNARPRKSLFNYEQESVTRLSKNRAVEERVACP